MTYIFKTKGVCAREIEITVEDNIVKNVKFLGGCAGNTKGVARLIEGMDATEAIKRIEGIPCGFKSTSCPDQLAKAIRQALESN